MDDKNKKLGLWGLTGIVFGSMIGGGIFTMAQSLSVGASAGAVLTAWGVTAVGILFLVLTFKLLSDARPDLNAGMYQYAQEGFGNYLGFNIAWGYWLCTSFANVAYAVVLNDTLGAFFPVLFDHGFLSVALGSMMIWAMYLIAINGIRTASIINGVITAIKFSSLVLIVVLLVINFRMGMFTADFWGLSMGIGPVTSQVQNSMMVTLWCFIGIEGAVMMSARARRASDVGRASIMGFVLAWVLYVLVSLLCYGIMNRADMVGLEEPSIAYVLKHVCGSWAYYFVIIAVIFSLLGGWVAWTLICAQVPYEAAKVRIMPDHFLSVNKHGVPAFGLFVCSLIMQGFLLIVFSSEHVYRAALEITGMMVLPAYLFSGIFLVKASLLPKRYLPGVASGRRWMYCLCGVLCSAFCLFTIISGGVDLLLVTSLFYITGSYFFVRARRQYDPQHRDRLVDLLTPAERWGFVALCLACAASAVLLVMGKITL